MSETQQLLGKIAALRQRLEQAQGLLFDAGSLLQKDPRSGLALLEKKVAGGDRDTALL